MDNFTEINAALHQAQIRETTRLRERLDASCDFKVNPSPETRLALDEANERYWAAVAVLRGAEGRVLNFALEIEHSQNERKD